MKKFLLQKMLDSKLKGVPEDQKEKIFKLFEENPELMMKLASSVQGKISSGADQFSAVKAVLEEHKDELEGIL